jgi:hypothetical protein
MHSRRSLYAVERRQIFVYMYVISSIPSADRPVRLRFVLECSLKEVYDMIQNRLNGYAVTCAGDVNGKSKMFKLPLTTQQ